MRAGRGVGGVTVNEIEPCGADAGGAAALERMPWKETAGADRLGALSAFSDGA